MGSGRREQAEIWKWRSFLRKSGFPHETTQGTDSATEPAAKNNTCGVFGLISDKGWYKVRINVGLEGRRRMLPRQLVHWFVLLKFYAMSVSVTDNLRSFRVQIQLA